VKGCGAPSSGSWLSDEDLTTSEGRYDMPLNIVAIQGSVRPGNYTAKALAVVVDELRGRPNVHCDVVDPAAMHLPFPGQGDSADAEALAQHVRDATGMILATPEYHGSLSSVMKLVLENLGFPSALAGKPVALLGVAAGQIGAIKSLEQLRSVCSHVGAIVLPGPVSVANVRGLFDEEGRCTDEKVERQIRGVATTLLDYIERAVCPAIALEHMVREGAGRSS
jgi:FMN reductase